MYMLMKFHQNNAGHMSKMAAIPIYGKKRFENLFFKEALGRFVFIKLCSEASEV